MNSAKPLKILHIGKYFPPFAGGMETYLRDLMVAQTKQGLKPAALVHQSNLSLKSSSEEYTAGGTSLPITRAAVWARAIFTPISPTFPWHLHQMIKRDQPDILHLHMPNVSAFWALLLPSARKIPWVIHWHADVLASAHSLGLRLFYTLYRPLERALLRLSKCIIATSPPYLASSEPLRDFHDKCKVVPLGLDPTNLAQPSTVIKRENPSNLRVLAIGRLTYYKGFEYLIRAVASLEGVELHLVGTGELESKLKNLASELQATEKITFHGKLPDGALAAQFQACDCLCLPSIERTEAFGMVLLEAMSHGKTTIVSKVEGSGMQWIVENTINGLHVAPQDTLALAKSLQHLHECHDRIERFGNTGRARFFCQFHIDQSAAKILTNYRDVIENSAGYVSKT